MPAVISVAPVVSTLPSKIIKNSENCRRKTNRSVAGIPGVLSAVEFQLGVGVREDGDVYLPEAVCGSWDAGLNCFKDLHVLRIYRS